MNQSVENLTVLREHLRLTWKSTMTAYYLVEDTTQLEGEISGLDYQHYLKKQDAKFHSSSASAYLFLTASRSFIRTAEKALNVMDVSIPAALDQERNEKFPEHKKIRDILEHFDQYALGEGRLQTAEDGNVNKNFSEHALTVKRPDLKKFFGREEVYIHVSNFTPIPLSEFGWWIDKLNLHVEARFQEKINPGLEYQGFWPDNNYQAPPDWETRMS